MNNKVHGEELKFEDFVKEYNNEDNNGGSVELIDIDSDEVSEVSEKEFKEMIKGFDLNE